MSLFTAIGLMSGTSGDGIDAAVIRSDGRDNVEWGPTQTYAYNPNFRQQLKQVLQSPSILESYVGGALHPLEHELTQHHATIVQDFVKNLPSSWNSIDLVGFHGQTIYHNPGHGDVRWRTIQLGDGQLLANLTGLPVIFDFRRADVEAGGQGAPLAPIYHQALVQSAAKPVAILNIGGIANVTWISSNQDDLWAFDTGPGNALIDDWIHHHTGAFYDQDGHIASQGKCQQPYLDQLLAHPYFQKLPPKSLDRNDFSWKSLQNLSLEDGAATLVAFTVNSIIKGLDLVPSMPHSLYVTGGGRHNQTILQGLRQKFKGKVAMIEDLGVDGDGLEAQLFAYLAVRSSLNLPLSFPKTTGVKEPICGGRLVLPLTSTRSQIVRNSKIHSVN